MDTGTSRTPQVLRKAIIKLTYRCNNRCLFCRALPLAQIQENLDTKTAIRKIVMAQKMGVQVVLFSGGEPTLVRDLPKLVRVVKALGMDFGLITNARRLAYSGYFKKISALKPAYVHTSLLGANPDTHNALTMADPFDDLLNALKNMKEAGIPDINVNTVITALNLGELQGIIDLLADFAPLTYKMTLMEPSGLYENNSARIAVKAQDAANAAIEALNYGVSRYGDRGIKIGIEGFPLCMVRGYESFVENMMTQGILYMSEVFEDRFYPVDHGERHYFHACHLCSRKLECPGQFSAYGSQGLEPFTDHVPLAYPMLLHTDNHGISGELTGDTHCPAFQWSREANLNERNGLCVQQKDKIDYYMLEDGHADGLLVQRLKDRGQVYLDQRQKAVKPGTPIQVPVQLHKTCENCGIGYACPGVFKRVNAGRYYKRLDQMVIQVLKEIAGRVTDLGCARSYYTPVLMDMIDEGRIIYTGVDHRGNLDLPEAIERGATLIHADPQEVVLDAGSMDWVLILDSVNEFADPVGVLAKARHWLARGGRVLIVDRDPFLLLTTKQKEAWDLGSRRRNATMLEVTHWLEESGFELQVLVKPRAGRTNLWLVTAVKKGE